MGQPVMLELLMNWEYYLRGTGKLAFSKRLRILTSVFIARIGLSRIQLVDRFARCIVQRST